MIIKEKNKKIVLFNDVNLGDVFCYDGNYYIKTNDARDNKGCLNCVMLPDCDFYWFESDERIELVDAILNIEE